MSEVKQNIRLRFSKEADIRFISHHDLMRVFARALRRAGLPVAMSEGYNPRPRISLPAPLSVGHRGASEIADVGLARWTRPAEVRSRLQAELPEGIRVQSAEIISPHPNRQPREFAYRIPLLAGHCLRISGVRSLLAREEILVSRRCKDGAREVEIRPFIRQLRLDGDSVVMLLSCDNRGTARPQEVMRALGCSDGADYFESAIERTNVRLAS